jgi:hypothetical protein
MGTAKEVGGGNNWMRGIKYELERLGVGNIWMKE